MVQEIKLFDYLPDIYAQIDETEASNALSRMLSAFDVVFNRDHGRVAEFPDIVSIDESDDKWIDDILLADANPFDISLLNTQEKRSLARQLFDLYKKKGTKAGIVSACRAVLKTETMVLDWWTDLGGHVSKRIPTEYFQLNNPEGRSWGVLAPENYQNLEARGGYFPGATEFDSEISPAHLGALTGVANFKITGGDSWPSSVIGEIDVDDFGMSDGSVGTPVPDDYTVIAEYSLNGGYSWLGAMEAVMNVGVNIETKGTATYATQKLQSVIWDTDAEGIGKDEASRGVLFRITIIDNATGEYGEGWVSDYFFVNNTGNSDASGLDVPDLKVMPFIVNEDRLLNTGWKLGVTSFGNLSGVYWKEDPRRYPAYHFEVIILKVDPGTNLIEQVRQIAEFMKPASSHLTVSTLQEPGETLEGWILNKSSLGDQTKI